MRLIDSDDQNKIKWFIEFNFFVGLFPFFSFLFRNALKSVFTFGRSEQCYYRLTSDDRLKIRAQSNHPFPMSQQNREQMHFAGLWFAIRYKLSNCIVWRSTSTLNTLHSDTIATFYEFTVYFFLYFSLDFVWARISDRKNSLTYQSKLNLSITFVRTSYLWL